MAWTFTLCDRASDTDLADLTGWALTSKVSVRLNRPTSVELTMPGDQAVLQGTAFDGLPLLWPGVRTIKARQDGQLRAHVIAWNFAPSGDANSTSWLLTGYDPMLMLQRRLVRSGPEAGDDAGAFADPTFPSPISGAELIQMAIDNTALYDGPLPIDTASGPVASSVDLAADLSNWPITVGDLITMLTDTGQLDVYMFPVDTHVGFPAGTVAELWASDTIGSDLTGSVNFDYAIGDYSLANVRRSFDADNLCNKLYYYLGGRIDSRHYQGNITATEAGLEAYAALQNASRDKYGVFMDVRIVDDNDAKLEARPLFHELWKTEVSLRVEPRELLYITPSADAPYRPFVHYSPGDIVGVNASSIVGPAITGASQRIYGFDVTGDANVSEVVSELVTSADGA